MWKRVTVTLWPSVNCLYRHKDNFARGQSVFKCANLSVTTCQSIIIHTNSRVIILLVSTMTWLIQMWDKHIEGNPRTFRQRKDFPNKKSHSATIQRASVLTLRQGLFVADVHAQRWWSIQCYSEALAAPKYQLTPRSVHRGVVLRNCSPFRFCSVGRRVQSESLTASAFLRPSGTSVKCQRHAQRRSPEQTGLDASPSPQIVVQQEWKQMAVIENGQKPPSGRLFAHCIPSMSFSLFLSLDRVY